VISRAATFLKRESHSATPWGARTFPLDAVSSGQLAYVDKRAPPRALRDYETPNHFSPVELQEIRRIVELMNEHGLTLFDLTKKDFHLKLKKGADMDDFRGLLASLPAAAPAPAPAAAAPSAVASAPTPELEGTEITSPMVGTFYRKPAPDTPNFVEIGSTVSVGQTVCIIEAMKVMNEIKAEKAGTICACVAEDGTSVQYGDVLFRIK